MAFMAEMALIQNTVSFAVSKTSSISKHSCFANRSCEPSFDINCCHFCSSVFLLL